MIKFVGESKTQNSNQNQAKSKKGRARFHPSRAKKEVAQKKIRDKRRTGKGRLRDYAYCTA